MLVDASKFPGPALWQGLMFIVVLIWIVWLFSSFEHTAKQVWISISIVVVIGITLFVLIINNS